MKQSWFRPRTKGTQRELFVKISNFWAWAEIFGWNFLRHLGYFHYSTIISKKKKLSLYIQLPNIYLGLGSEFGPQRIRDLAIMCPPYVSQTMHCFALILTKKIIKVCTQIKRPTKRNNKTEVMTLSPPFSLELDPLCNFHRKPKINSFFNDLATELAHLGAP